MSAKRFTCLVSVCCLSLLAAFTFGACSLDGDTDLEATVTSSSESTSSSEETITLYLSKSVDEVASKTVFPTTPTIASLNLYGYCYSPYTTVDIDWTTDEWDADSTIALLPSTLWTLTLSAFDADGNLVLEGSDALRLTETTSLEFTLTPLTDDTGTVDLTLVWPQSSDVATVDIYYSSTAGKTPNTQLVEYTAEDWTAGSSTYSVEYANDEFTAGNWTFAFVLYNEVGRLVGSATQMVLVRDYLTSSKTLTLAASSINSRPQAPTDLAVVQQENLTDSDNTTAVLTWKDNADNETRYMVWYSDDEGSNWDNSSYLDPDTESYTDSVPRGTTRVYKVEVFNDYCTWSNGRYTDEEEFDGNYFLLTIDPESSTADTTVLESAPGAEVDLSAYTPDSPDAASVTFSGWATEEGSSTVAYEAGATYTTGSENAGLYAVWTVIPYAITYELDGGTNSSSNPDTYTYTSTVTLEDPTRTDYLFGGWYTTSTFDDDSKITEITAGSTTGDLTLYALWADANGTEDTGITVTVDMEGDGDVSFSSDSSTVEQGETLTVTISGSYTYYGWYLDGDKISGSKSSISIDTSDLSVGIHSLTVVVDDADGEYSSSFKFTVE